MTLDQELGAMGAWLTLVGELWLTPPGPQHLAGLDALAQLTGEAALEVGEVEGLAQVWQQHLRVPGPQNLEPYEAVFCPHQGHAARVAVAELYGRAGYRLAPYDHELPDHLGHELRFVGSLLHTASQRLREGKAQAAANLQSWARGFLRDHLGRWAEPFAKEADARAAHPFFPALARAGLWLVREAYGESAS